MDPDQQMLKNIDKKCPGWQISARTFLKCWAGLSNINDLITKRGVLCLKGKI